MRTICVLAIILLMLITSIFAANGPEVKTSGVDKGQLKIDGKDYNCCDDCTFTFAL